LIGTFFYTTMLRWIIIFAVVYVIIRVLRGSSWFKTIPRKAPPREIQDEMVEDPVCKVYVPKGRSLVLHLEGGKKEYFCSPACRDHYKEKVLKKSDHSSE